VKGGGPSPLISQILKLVFGLNPEAFVLGGVQ